MTSITAMVTPRLGREARRGTGRRLNFTGYEGKSMGKRIDARNLNIYYDKFLAVAKVNLTVDPCRITAFIGPSGTGKSTVLRALNRLHELAPTGRVEGTVLLDGQDIYDGAVDVVRVRRMIGMVFQQPNPFPTMSIYENAVAGLTLIGKRPDKAVLDEAAETSLRRANLWEEVKDRLTDPGAGLSGGQQQRLCIARAIAVNPEVLLMDEPASALDPISTLVIEDLMQSLKHQLTIVVVTHNMEQAARVSDKTAFFNLAAVGQPGELIEMDDTTKIFTNPADPRTEAYISGRFGRSVRLHRLRTNMASVVNAAQVGLGLRRP
jgi:phosphate transport system ATP-binding protein